MRVALYEPEIAGNVGAVLRLGALAVPAVVTLKPAYAAVTSVMTCQIPITKWVDAQGNVKAANSSGAFAPPSGSA